jgi:imidazolonepropionase-like amidohydrolase
MPRVSHVAPPQRRMHDRANGGAGSPAQAAARLRRSLQIVKALHDAGVPIVAGTDKGVPGISLAREIELYVEAGFSPIDAIRAASAVPARIMGQANETGTIAPGLRADVIVVDGNPLVRIADNERVALASAGGTCYEPAHHRPAGGFR